MKRWFMVPVLLVALALPIGGCATSNGGGNWQDDVPRMKADIFLFSKLATRIALIEANMPTEDIVIVEGYLVALKSLLEVPGQPNFAGARELVNTELKKKYQVYGLIIIDVLERYLQLSNLDVTEDQEAIIALLSAGIDGALMAVQEFSG